MKLTLLQVAGSPVPSSTPVRTTAEQTLRLQDENTLYATADVDLKETMRVLLEEAGYGQPENQAHALDAGFDDHLTKPIDDDDLRRIMHRLAPHAHAAGATQTPACG